jgi:SAM-dependent methyltransferase
MSKSDFKAWEKYHVNRKAFPSWPSETLVRLLKGNFLKKKINLKKNSRVLDVGCGFGNNLLLFKDFEVELFGTEVTKKTCEIPKKNLLNNNLSANIIPGTNTNIPFQSNFFDLILSINVIQYEKNEKNIIQSLREYKRVLKKNGSFIIITVGPKHFSYDHVEIVAPHIYELKNWHFIKKQTFFHFDNVKHLEFYLKKHFKNLEFGQAYENLMGMELDYMISKGTK